MSLNSSSVGGLECAISWNIRVRSEIHRDTFSNTHGHAADTKVVYRRYASLFFVCGIGSADNELVTLEIVHRYVEVLDRYFGNVSPVSLVPFGRNLRSFIGL